MDMLINLLEHALNDPENRMRFVRRFQELVWDSPEFPEDDGTGELLVELADELDYYVPDPVLRAEAVAYFGDSELETKLRSVLQVLRPGNMEPGSLS